MPRLRQVPRAEADPIATMMYDMLFGERDPVEEPGTETGTPGNWWTVFALVPDCLKHAIDGFRFYRDPARKLDPQETTQTDPQKKRATATLELASRDCVCV